MLKDFAHFRRDLDTRSSMATATATQPLERREVEQLVREVLRQRLRGGAPSTAVAPPSAREQHAAMPRADGGPPHPLVVNVSARHMHVTPADLETLFGPGAKLTKLKDLYQQGEFASEQLVTIVGPRQ